MHGPHELKVHIHYSLNYEIWLSKRFCWLDHQNLFCR